MPYHYGSKKGERENMVQSMRGKLTTCERGLKSTVKEEKTRNHTEKNSRQIDRGIRNSGFGKKY